MEGPSVRRARTMLVSVAMLLAAVLAVSLDPAAVLGYNEPPREVKRAERKALVSINHMRADHGLKPLRMAHRVRRVARARARDMRAQDYFSHVSPTGRDAAALMVRHNVSYSAASENIGWVSFVGWRKTGRAMAKAWFESRRHRAKVLSRRFDRVGIGAARAGNAVYWTAIFVR